MSHLCAWPAQPAPPVPRGWLASARFRVLQAAGSSHASEPLLWFLHHPSENVQNHSIIFANYSATLCEGSSIINTRQRTCLSVFVGMMEELSTWTSKEVAHSLPGKDRPSTLPARYALIPCSRHPLRHVRSG